MKKFLAILVTAMAVLFASSSLSSCSKASDTLAGTTWTGNYGTEMYTLTFTSESSFTMLYQDNGYSDSGTGTYTRSGSSITLIMNGEAATGTINGNTLILNNNGITIVFSKR